MVPDLSEGVDLRHGFTLPLHSLCDPGLCILLTGFFGLLVIFINAAPPAYQSTGGGGCLICIEHIVSPNPESSRLRRYIAGALAPVSMPVAKAVHAPPIPPEQGRMLAAAANQRQMN